MIRRSLALVLTTFLCLASLSWVVVTPACASLARMNKLSILENGYMGLAMPGGEGNSPVTTGKQLLQQSSGKYTSDLRIPVSQSAFLDKKIPDGVALFMSGTSQVNLTEPITLSGFLKDTSTGGMIAGKSIKFSTNGNLLGQTHTDANGAFQIEIKKDLSAGFYLVTASFDGAHLLAPASATFSVEVLPAIVRVETVPAIPGITFKMDGRQFISGPDGSATININQAGTYRLDVLLDQYHNPSQQVEFGRWSEESYQPFRTVTVPANTPIQVGLNVYHRVSFKFIDLDSLSVDPSRIISISIRSAQGDVFSLKPGDTPWLPSSRTARRQAGLEETKLLYSVNSITIDGSNVVNSAQQRFYAQTDDTWTISLLLFSLRINTKDGLFAAPVGTSVNVGFPDGQVKNYLLDKTGKLQIHALARGIYHISLIGVKGLGTSTPVALSRNQVVNLNIVTPLDLAVVGSVCSGLGLGLIIYGRPWLLGFLLRRKRNPSRKLRWTSQHEN